jgi:hypothetical protein
MLLWVRVPGGTTAGRPSFLRLVPDTGLAFPPGVCPGAGRKRPIAGLPLTAPGKAYGAAQQEPGEMGVQFKVVAI